MEIIVALVAGYIIGVLQGGIKITVNQRPKRSKMKDNEFVSLDPKLIPDEIRQYAEQNKGFIRW